MKLIRDFYTDLVHGKPEECLKHLDTYRRKNNLVAFLFKTLMDKFSKGIDLYHVLANIQGVSYQRTWLVPVALDLILLIKAARIDLKIHCCGQASLTTFERAIYHELHLCVTKLF